MRQGLYETIWRDFWLLKIRCEVLLTQRPITMTFIDHGTLSSFVLSPHCELAVLVGEMRNIACNLETAFLSTDDLANPQPHISWLAL